jgi:hypothetical protein
VRWLLTPLGIGLLAFVSMGVEQASGSTYLVSATLHPAAYAGENRLSCGWHQVCDGVGPDSLLNGTDWYSNQDFGGYARARLQSGKLGIAGWFKIESIYQGSGCWYVTVRFQDREYERIGTLTLLHIDSDYPVGRALGLITWDSGWQTEWRIGDYVDDGCVNGLHVHHRYAFGPGVSNSEWYYWDTGCEVSSGSVGFCYPACSYCAPPCYGCNTLINPWAKILFWNSYYTNY